jgi:hypothetical protein
MTEEREQYALVPHRGQLVNNFDEAARAAKAMAQSGYFSDAREVAQAMVKVLAGHEMGFGPFASMTGIHVIKGQPTIGANLMAAAVKAHPGYDYRADVKDNAVSITFYQNGNELGTSTFTMANAKDAGLTGRDNWKKYTRNMLFARAMSNGVRWYCPDVFAGSTVYTPDELDDEASAPQWNVVDGEAVEREIAPPAPREPTETVEPQRQPSDNGSNGAEPEGPPWRSSWHAFATRAQSELGYNHNKHVVNTLRKELDDNGVWWNASGDLVGDPDELWATLKEHQAAKGEVIGKQEGLL